MVDAQVTYDVKDLLDRIEAKIDKIDRRVELLEQSRQSSNAISALGGKAWIAAVACLGVVVNIPAAMFYLGH
jgi:hypothetical protein